MRLVLLVTLTMIAFAANSVLNRMAISGGHIDATSFGVIRLLSGAVMLGVLCVLSRGGLRLGGPARAVGVISLLIYLVGFTLAYNDLDAGLGALILFGVVQLTMFGGGIKAGEAMPATRWLGAGLAFAGLIWLLWPDRSGGTDPISLPHAALMALAGFGWGLYSLAGRRATDALQATAANFVLSAPVGLVVWLAVSQSDAVLSISATGLILAVVCGAVTSGLGYALWYSLLPRLDASVAATAQLTVPVIALLGGVLFIGEGVTWAFLTASALVLGGVTLSIRPARNS